MAIVAAAGKEKSPSTRRCVPGLSIDLLIGQPLFEDCSILCFYLHKLDAHSFCRDIMGHSAEGREHGSSMLMRTRIRVPLGSGAVDLTKQPPALKSRVIKTCSFHEPSSFTSAVAPKL